MKRTVGFSIAVLLMMGLAFCAFGQGTVNFANASTTAGLPLANRNVVWPYNPFPSINDRNVSSNYAGLNLTGLRVQLYTGTGTDVSTWQAVPGTLSTFKQSTSATAGSWFSKTGTITPGAPGAIVNLAVVVWDSNLDAANPFSVAARLGLWGQSSIFQYTITANPTPAPSEFLMLNFNGMVVGIPEPSSLTLACLGGAAFALARRRWRLIP